MDDEKTIEVVKAILRVIKLRELNGYYEVKYTRACKECGKSFTTFKKGKRYCSAECAARLKARVFPLWGEENVKKDYVSRQTRCSQTEYTNLF